MNGLYCNHPNQLNGSSMAASPSKAAMNQDSADEHDARLRILTTAERLLTQHGYSGVSLRTIMTEAAVNTAAVHYYFRNKLGLLRAIFELHVGPINAEREKLLDAFEQSAAPSPRPIRDVLHAFIAPAIRITRRPGGETFNKLSGLCSVDPNPDVRRVVFDAYHAVAQRFVRLLRQACGHLSEREFYWRLHCVYGSMMYIRSDNGRVAVLLGDVGASEDTEFVLAELIEFLAVGLENCRLED
jgi:AcrR family transcriptional regulator